MFTNLLTESQGEITMEAQGGIPVGFWIIVCVIAAIILFVISVKLFWVSKIIATLLGGVGLFSIILGMGDSNILVFLGVPEESIIYVMDEFISSGLDFLADVDLNIFITTTLGAIIFFIAWIYLMGNSIFDSHTEGDYLIAGTLVHDTNHPVAAFFGSAGAFLFLGILLAFASYYWTLIIFLVFFGLTIFLGIGMMVEKIAKG